MEFSQTFKFAFHLRHLWFKDTFPTTRAVKFFNRASVGRQDAGTEVANSLSLVSYVYDSVSFLTVKSLPLQTAQRNQFTSPHPANNPSGRTDNAAGIPNYIQTLRTIAFKTKESTTTAPHRPTKFLLAFSIQRFHLIDTWIQGARQIARVTCCVADKIEHFKWL